MDKHLRPVRFDADINTPNVEKEWKHWFRTFENFLGTLTFTGTDEENQTAKLNALTVYISPSVYEYIQDTTTYDGAIAILKNLYVKPKNIIYNRHKLATRIQSEGETVDQYMQTLEQLSKSCDFAAVSAELNRTEYIRDAFINGLASNVIRQRLLENNNLTLAQAYQTARTLELAQKHSSSYSHSSNNLTPGNVVATASENVPEVPLPDNDVLAATRNPQHRDSDFKKCRYCGGNMHQTRRQCPASSSKCDFCHKKGHWAVVCHKKRQQENGGLGAVAHTPVLMGVSQKRHKRRKHLPTPGKRDVTHIKTTIKGKTMNSIVDSGSDFTFTSHSKAEELDLLILPPSEEHKNITLADVSNSAVIGEVVTDIIVQGKTYSMVVLVMKNLFTDLILGKDFMQKHKSVTFKFEETPESLPPLVLSDLSSPVCAFTAMDVDPPSLFSHMSPDIKPISCKSKRYSKSDADFIDETVRDWYSKGIIEPSNSPWRAQPLVTTESETHRRRVVIDYSRTVNRYTQLDAYPLPRIDDMANDVSKYKYYATYDLKSAYHQVEIPLADRPYTAFEASGKLWQFTRIPNGVTNGVAAFQRVLDTLVEKEGLDDTFVYVDNVTVCGNTEEDLELNRQKWESLAKKYNLTFNLDKCIFSCTRLALMGYIVEHNSVKPDPERLKPLMELPSPQDLPSQGPIVGLFSY